MEKEREVFKQWMKRYKRYSKKTIKEYIMYYDKFQLGTGLKKENVVPFLDFYNNCPPAKAFFKCYCKFVKRHIEQYPNMNKGDILDLLDEIPDSPRRSKPVPVVITETQMIKIRDALKKEKYRIMLMIQFYAGLRASELLHLTPADFNFDAWKENPKNPCELRVRGEIAKRNRDRVVFVHAPIVHRIRRYIIEQYKKGKIKERTDFLFPGFNAEGTMNGATWRRKVHMVSKEVLPSPIHTHTLRHSFATNLLNKGASLEELKYLLGHEDIATTQIYARVSPKKALKCYKEASSKFLEQG